MADWQKSFRRTPPEIEKKIRGFESKSAVVGCATKLSEKDVRDGVYEHLGIGLDKGKLSFPDSVVPDASAGRYSDSNANGHEIVRKDLPMTTKTYSFEAPNYGDWSNGSHEVSWDKQVYQREFVPPAENEIRIELIGEEGSGADKGYVFRFTIDQPLTIGARGYKDELFRLLNLLQENVGAADVFPSDAKLEDYLRTIYVNWEILPPGERDKNIAKITASVRNADEETRKRIADRYDFFEKMKPEALIQGQGGFRRYFGAKFSDELVAFENMEYGNAVYVMRKDWKDASKKTKQELSRSYLRAVVKGKISSGSCTAKDGRLRFARSSTRIEISPLSTERRTCVIAMKRSAGQTRYKKWMQQAADAGRTGFAVECSGCKEKYVVYYGPAMEEAEARKEFEQNIEREHNTNPAHQRDGFAIGENFPMPTDEPTRE